MNAELGIAGVIGVALAIGHATIGLGWVLPRIDADRLPATPFGPPPTTLGLIRVSWHIVTIFVLTFAVILLTLAVDDAADPTTVLLRSFAVMWIAATGMALWVARRNPRNFLRRPVWSLWLVLAVLCWVAST